MAAFPWRGHTWGVGLLRYQIKQEGYFQCLWWMWCSRHGIILSLFRSFSYTHPHFLSFTLSVCLSIFFCSKAAEAGELKVTCGWARGCNTGHGSCLSLPLVSCVAASGTAALSTSEMEGSITLGEHYTILQWLPVKSFLFSSSSERKHRADNGV